MEASWTEVVSLYFPDLIIHGDFPMTNINFVIDFGYVSVVIDRDREFLLIVIHDK